MPKRDERQHSEGRGATPVGQKLPIVGSIDSTVGHCCETEDRPSQSKEHRSLAFGQFRLAEERTAHRSQHHSMLGQRLAGRQGRTGWGTPMSAS